MTDTPNLGIAQLVEGQKSAATAVNTAFNILDTAVNARVEDSAPSTTPNPNPAEGATFIVPASATGDWLDKDTQLAVWHSGWVFIVPKIGWKVWDLRNHRYMVFRGSSWEAFQAARVAELTDSTGGAEGSALLTLAGLVYSDDAADIADNFSALNGQMKAIMDAMITAGLMAGDKLTSKVVNESVAIASTLDSQITAE